MTSRTMSVEEAAEEIGAPSPRWLVEQIKAGIIPARKISRNWRLTVADVEAALEIYRHGPTVATPTGDRHLSLTATSARRQRSA